MKKIVRSILASVVAFCLATMGSAVLAVENGRPEQGALENMLPAILGVPSEFGIDAQNIEQLYLGDALMVYEKTGSDIEALQAKVYPVFLEGQIKGMFTETVNISGEKNYTYGVEFAHELQKYINEYTNVLALVYCEDNVYAVSSNYPVVCLSDGEKDAIDIFPLQVEDVYGQAVTPLYKLSAVQHARAAETKTLPIPYVSQRGPTCWAACIASVVNYLTGTSLQTYQVVVTCQPNAPAAGASAAKVAGYLTNNYNLSSYSSNGPVQYENLYWQINANRPMLFSGYRNQSGSSSLDDNGRHMVAVYGYYKNLSTEVAQFYYMEPNTGFKVGTFSNSGAPQFQINANQTYTQDRYVTIR